MSGNWHTGALEFSYIRVNDPGFTVWIPLDPVGARHPGGMLELIPEGIYSGRDLNRMFSAFLKGFLNDPQMIRRVMTQEKANEALRTSIFEHYKVSFACNPGDVVIYNRYLFHRFTSQKSNFSGLRRSLALRMVGADSCLDMDLYRRTREFSLIINHPRPLPIAEVLSRGKEKKKHRKVG
jgi:hypothetical protein